MKKSINKIVLSTLTAAMLVGCGGGSSSNSSSVTTNASGLPSHGPFVEGTIVKAIQLNSDGTEGTLSVQTTVGSDYKFSFPNLSWTGPTKFIIENGQYYNEATGGFSIGSLSAIENVLSGDKPNININILTHIASKNIIEQMKNGANISDAKNSAKNTISQIFNISLPSGVDLEDLNLTDGTQGESQTANTQLLQLSTAILSTNNPDEVIENLANDLEKDINIDEEALGSLEKVQEEIQNVDLSEVARKMETTLNLNNIPNSNNLLNGTLVANHGIKFVSRNDASKETLYIGKLTVPAIAIYGESAKISIGNIGQYRINGGLWTTEVGNISNNDILEVNLNSSSEYSTSVSSEITIAGIKIPFIVTTESSPFITDVTPDNFSLGFKKDITPNTLNVESSSFKVSGINSPTSVSIQNGEYSISLDNGSTWNPWTNSVSNVENGNLVKVRTDAASSFSKTTNTILTIGSVSNTFKVFTLVEDKIPDLITFNNLNINVEPSTVIESEIKTLSGFNSVVPISIENGEISINDGSYLTSGNVNVGDTIKIRHTSSSEYSKEKISKIKIGTQVYEFKSSTKADPHANDDKIPNVLVFDSLNNQELDSLIESSVQTISGINTDTTISISANSEYKIGSGSWTNQAATISPDDEIQVRHNSSNLYQTKTETVLTIGGVANKFISYTKAKNDLVNKFEFSTKTGVSQNETQESNSITISGINVDVPISIENGEYSINGGSFSSSSGIISNGNTLVVKHNSASVGGTDTYTKVKIGNYSTIFKSTTTYSIPEISGTPSSNIDVGTSYSFKPTIISGDAISSWTISGNPSWMKINEITGEIYGTPTKVDEQVSSSSIIITAVNQGGSDTLEFSLNVNNIKPVLNVSNSNITASIFNDINIMPTVTDTIGDTHTFELSSTAPTFLSIDPATGKVTNNRELNSNDIKNYSFDIIVKDKSNETVSKTITLEVIQFSDVSTPPQISGTPDLIVTQGGTYSFTPISSDINSNNLIFEISNLPDWAEFDSSTGKLSNKLNRPNNSDVGTYSNIVISVKEASDTVSLDSFAVEVTNVNDAPTVKTPVSDLTLLEGTSFSTSDLRANFEDIDIDDTLTYDVTFANGDLLPNWMSFVNGILTVNATNENVGEHLMKITATDKANQKVVDEFKITVTNTNDLPIGVEDIALVDEDGEVLIDVLSNDTDADKDSILSIDSVTASTNATAVIENGKVKYTPKANFNGEDTFTYIVKDEKEGKSASTTVTVNVKSINDVPTTSDSSFSVITLDELTGTLSGSDVDLQDNLSFSLLSDVSNGTLSLNSNGTFTYTSNADYIGSDSFTFKVNDGTTDSNESTVTINVSAGMPLPKDVDDAIKKLELIDPETENITTKLDEIKALLNDSSTTESELFKLMIELAEILNDEDIATLLNITITDSTIENTSTLNKIIRGMVTDAVKINLSLNDEQTTILTDTSMSKLNKIADQLKLISLELGNIYTSTDDVYAYGKDSMTYNDSLAMRAGILGFAAKLKNLSSYKWGTDADFKPREQVSGEMVFEYTNFSINPAKIFNSGNFYKLDATTAPTRLPEAKNLLIDAANLLLNLPVGYEEMTQDDLDDIDAIKLSLTGSEPYIMTMKNDEELKEVTIDLAKMFDSSTALDISNLGTNWQNLCDDGGDMVSEKLAKTYGELSCLSKYPNYWYNEDTNEYNEYYHYERSSLIVEPQTKPMADVSKLDDIVLNMTKLDDTVLQGQGVIDFIFKNKNFEAFDRDWKNEKKDERYLVSGNNAKFVYGKIYVDSYISDTESRADAITYFGSNPKQAVKAKVYLEDGDSSLSRGVFKADFLDVGNNQAISASINVKAGKVDAYIWDETNNVELISTKTILTGNFLSPEGTTKVKIKIAVDGNKIIASAVPEINGVEQTSSANSVTFDLTEKLTNINKVAIDSARFRAQTKVGASVDTKFRAAGFDFVDFENLLPSATLASGDKAILTNDDSWYDIMSVNNGSITLKMHEKDFDTFAYTESETFSINLTDGSSTFSITQSGQEKTAEISNTLKVANYTDLYKSNIKFTNTVETSESNTWGWDNHGATDLDSLVNVFTNGYTYFEELNIVLMLKSDNTVVLGTFVGVDSNNNKNYTPSLTLVGSWQKNVASNKIDVDLSEKYKVLKSFELDESNKIVDNSIYQIGFISNDLLYTGDDVLQFFQDKTGINPNE